MFLEFLIKKERLMLGNSDMTAAERVQLLQQLLQQEPLSHIQQRLIHANVIRRNRIEFTMKSKPSVRALPLERLADKSPDVPTSPTAATKEVANAVTKSSKTDLKNGSNGQKTPIVQAAAMAQTATQTATEVASSFNLDTAMAKRRASSILTRATHIGKNQNYPRCPVYDKGMIIKCPYCAEPLPKECAVDSSMWRYVKYHTKFRAKRINQKLEAMWPMTCCPISVYMRTARRRIHFTPNRTSCCHICMSSMHVIIGFAQYATWTLAGLTSLRLRKPGKTTQRRSTKTKPRHRNSRLFVRSAKGAAYKIYSARYVPTTIAPRLHLSTLHHTCIRLPSRLLHGMLRRGQPPHLYMMRVTLLEDRA